jgi:hypothetical protein
LEDFCEFLGGEFLIFDLLLLLFKFDYFLTGVLVLALVESSLAIFCSSL